MAKVLLHVSGSIAAFKAAEVVSALVKEGHEVRCALSESGAQFLGAAALEGLTRKPVMTDLFESGRALDHIDWVRWADVLLYCPVTAQTLNALASGVGQGSAVTLFLAADMEHKRPCVAVVPAMNPDMWSHPVTQKSRARLEELGVHVWLGEPGRTACGESGLGRMMEPECVVERVRELAAPVTEGPRVLVTLGGTRVPLDPVRFLGNGSTGRTGAAVAEGLARKGFQVTALAAEDAIHPMGVTVKKFRTYDDLGELLRSEISSQKFDAIIHAAAVSDWLVEPSPSKRASDELPDLKWTRAPKLLDSFREWSRNKSLKVISFKLITEPDPQAAASYLNRGLADAVVVNEWKDVGPETYSAQWVEPNAVGRSVLSRKDLIQIISEFLQPKENRNHDHDAGRRQ